METDIHDPTQFETTVYHEDCAEFEEVRELCLAEGNWLSHNFSRARLSISQHSGFAVIWDKRTKEPAAFAGIYRNEKLFPKNVARIGNRTYYFPKYRSRSYSGFIKQWKLGWTHVVEPLKQINDFDCYFMSMQNRQKKKTKGYFDLIFEALQEVSKGWNKHDKYLQTCPFPVQNCWQNFAYLEMTPGAFKQWSPVTIDHSEWLKLNKGDN